MVGKDSVIKSASIPVGPQLKVPQAPFSNQIHFSPFTLFLFIYLFLYVIVELIIFIL